MMKVKNVKTFLIMIITTMVSVPSYGQGQQGDKLKVNPIFREGTTTIKNPLDLRDPFKKKRRRLKKRKKNYGGYLTDGKYSNLPSIRSYPINQIRIVGVLLGNNRRAIAKISKGGDGNLDNETYMIKEGMKIGENDAEVKAIVPGGIVLVEKIRNVYDQDEYIETVIPVSTE
jgi:type IV pilus assembly protein PilP